MAKERLQKLMASAGIASRRDCEDIIEEGRVAVNGTVVRDLPVLVDPEHDRITIDGQALRTERKVYFMLHKPKGVFVTNDDPDGRARAMDLLVGVRERVFPVGRLDAESTGLLLMTNDGELAQRLTHPRYGIAKTYRAEVRGMVNDDVLAALRKGIYLPEGKVQVGEVRIIHPGRDKSVIEVTLREGRNREVRQVLARVGHAVRRLVRTGMGPLQLGDLPPGAFRPLRANELESLRKEASRQPTPRPPATRRKRRPPPRAARPASPSRPARPRAKPQ